MARSVWKPRIRRADGSLPDAVVTALTADIVSGRLPPGTRLPTHRALARTLGASLATITRAYTEAERRGLIRGRVGDGTFVHDLARADQYSPGLDPTRIDLGPTAIPMAPGDLGHLRLAASLANLAKRGDLVALAGYQDHSGSDAYRAAGVAWLRQVGVVAEVERVTLTAGAQHGLALALSTLPTEHGILGEALTYPGLIAAMGWRGQPIHPVSIDDQGIVPRALERTIRATKARVLVCTPTHHSPTAATMSNARREEIVAIARRHDLLIVEDGALAPLTTGRHRPLVSLAPERTWHLGSLSKTTFAGLRIGYLVSPADRRQPIARAAAATLWSVSPILAEIATEWVHDGTAEQLRNARREECAARVALAREILGPKHCSIQTPALFIWLSLSPRLAVDTVLDRAEREGVVLGPAHLFSTTASPPNALRISLGAARSRGDLTRGLTVLAQILTSRPT